LREPLARHRRIRGAMPRRDKGRPRLSAAGRVARNRRIVEQRDVEGLTFREIAGRFSLDERTVRDLYRETLAAIEAGEIADIDVDVTAAIARVIRVHLAALSRLETLAEEAGETNQGVGVLRASTDVGRGLLDTLARVGYLPDPAEARAHLEVREVATRMVSAVLSFREEVDVITENETVRRAADEVVRVFEEQMAPRDRPTLKVVS
jgi:hypothetical protein